MKEDDEKIMLVVRRRETPSYLGSSRNRRVLKRAIDTVIEEYIPS